VTYEEYVQELMRLLFQALDRPAPGEQELTSSREGEGEAAEKKDNNFLAQGVYKVLSIWYIMVGAVR